MRTIDFTTSSFRRTALILTFSPREKERTPLRDRFTRYRVRSSLPLGETLAQAAVRVQEWIGQRVVRGI